VASKPGIVTCPACRRRLSNYNAGPLCFPCEEAARSAAGSDVSAESAPPARDPKVEAVLFVAKRLLSKEPEGGRVPAEHNHSFIAGTFFTNFVSPGARPTRDHDDAYRGSYEDADGIHPASTVTFDSATQITVRSWSGVSRSAPQDVDLRFFPLHPSRSTPNGPGILTARQWSAMTRDDELVDLAEYVATLWPVLEVPPGREFYEFTVWSEGRREEPWNPRFAPRHDFTDLVLSARFVNTEESEGLPYIEIQFSGTHPPSPETFIAWYTDGPWTQWQEALWDGRKGLKRRRLPSQGSLIRGWTLYSLAVYADLGLRAAMRSWNTISPESQRLEVGGGRSHAT
jgi:hypothetical protein